MPYDENLEARIAGIVSPWDNTGSKKGFCGEVAGEVNAVEWIGTV